MITLNPKQIEKTLSVEIDKGRIVLTEWIDKSPCSPIFLTKEQARQLIEELGKLETKL